MRRRIEVNGTFVQKEEGLEDTQTADYCASLSIADRGTTSPPKAHRLSKAFAVRHVGRQKVFKGQLLTD
jgi:hypothetical protein